MAATKYDPEKDKVVRDLGEIEGTDLFVAVKCYDEGEEKLVVTRKVGKNKDKEKQELRMPVETAVQLARFILANFEKKEE